MDELHRQEAIAGVFADIEQAASTRFSFVAPDGALPSSRRIQTSRARPSEMRLPAMVVGLSLLTLSVIACSSGGSESSGPPPPTCSPGQVRIVGVVDGVTIDETHRLRASTVNQFSTPSSAKVEYDESPNATDVVDGRLVSIPPSGVIKLEWGGALSAGRSGATSSSSFTSTREGFFVGDLCGGSGSTVTIREDGGDFRLEALRSGGCSVAASGELRGCWANSN